MPGELDFIGQIWIIKSGCVWILIIITIGIPFCAFWCKLTINGYKMEMQKQHVHSITQIRIIQINCIVISCLVWIFGSMFLTIMLEIILFGPIAWILYIAYHNRFTGGYKSVLAKKLMEFILNKKSLYSDQIVNVLYQCPRGNSKHGHGSLKTMKLDDFANTYSFKEAGFVSMKCEGCSCLYGWIRHNDSPQTFNETRSFVGCVKCNFYLCKNCITEAINYHNNKKSRGLTNIDHDMKEFDDSKSFATEYETMNINCHDANSSLFRLLFVNYCCIELFKLDSCDNKYVEYLNKNMENNWNNVTLKSQMIAAYTSRKTQKKSSRFWIQFFNELQNYYYNTHNCSETFNFVWNYIKMVGKKQEKLSIRFNYHTHEIDFNHKFFVIYWRFVIFFIIPVFIISRIFSIFIPFICLFEYLISNKNIGLIQMIFTFVYAITISVYVVSLVKCIKFYNLTNNLFPPQKLKVYALRNGESHKRNVRRLNIINKLYNEYCYSQYYNHETKALLSKLLNNDVTEIILSYLPLTNLKTVLEKLTIHDTQKYVWC